ncbi:MAG: hypothetical protein D4R93_00470 [Deltaproteobacteria bacterium]|nr:MAG: hypothetical protein D4R93_00470 [Deltaproteobacteria bacterium]
MKKDYSIKMCKTLENEYRRLGLQRPLAVKRYDVGDIVEYDASAVAPDVSDKTSRVRVQIEEFVGGGFAGQVYKVKALSIEPDTPPGLQVANSYAMKILIPPSSGARFFRNLLYWIGFQGPFQLQSNPAAARAGALWQKFIRRGAKIRFGDESCVKDIYAIFVDTQLGSCGEISTWVEGRTWQLEVDDRMELLSRWKKGEKIPSEVLGSPEYRTKKQFMADFVKLLHNMGAYEFARQYEWSTCKSQPNCLKLDATDDDPYKGLVAMDFRAGLALLPFGPMSPGDFSLIWKGICRGSLVQFDRGDLKKFEAFVLAHKNEFADMMGLLGDLKTAEEIYRNSVPDITHNHIKLLYSGKLWSTIFSSAIAGWKIKNIIDAPTQERFQKHKISALPFSLLGLIPFLGSILRKAWGHTEWREHYKNCFSSMGYFLKALKGKWLERVMSWHRSGRITEESAPVLAHSLGLFLLHLPLSILPVGLYKFLTSWEYAKEKLAFIFVRPIRLYFNAEMREEWLGDMVELGKKKRIISTSDADEIIKTIKEPFIQKYLKSLAVHICLMPTTHVVATALAIYFIWTHPEMPRAQAWAIGFGIIAFFQLIPVSPGSLARGLYVLFLVIKERNFKDYSIALFLAFFKYVGYLAFPIQMTYRYPTLARFMAGHWATESVHVVPVFGESGALLEHGVFCLFYNWPLTIRRHMDLRAQKRSLMRPRYWHAAALALGAAGILIGTDMMYLKYAGIIPDLRHIWWLMAALPLIGGVMVSSGCGGAPMMKRIATAVVFGIFTSLIYMIIATSLGFHHYANVFQLGMACLWRLFVFGLFASMGALIMEFRLEKSDGC